MVNRYNCLSLIVTITCIFLIMEVQSEMFQIGEKRSHNKYCGPILSDMLARLCDGKYNTRKYKKSSYGMDTIESDEDYQQPSYLDDPKLPFPYRSRSKAAAILSGTFRRRRHAPGISNECCKKPCSVLELKSYCSL